MMTITKIMGSFSKTHDHSFCEEDTHISIHHLAIIVNQEIGNSRVYSSTNYPDKRLFLISFFFFLHFLVELPVTMLNSYTNVKRRKDHGMNLLVACAWIFTSNQRIIMIAL